MSDDIVVAKMTIDLKRNRFRIFRKTFRSIGSPLYIQFLINPEELYLAILGSDKQIATGTANKIRLDKINNGSIEFYSMLLMDGIQKIYGSLDCKCIYHLSGEVDELNRVAYFSLSSLKKSEVAQ